LQTEDAFTEHMKELPCYVMRSGRRFQDEQRITITTLQSMVNIYHQYSSGYFDLIITDECHRSIYGKWRKVLEHFDGIQIGLTATPCVKPPNEDGTVDDETVFVRDTLRFFGVDKPTFSYTLKHAIDEGYLVGYQIYKAKTVKTATADGINILRDEFKWYGLDPKTRKELEDAFVAAANLKPPQPHILIDPNVLERKFTIPARNQAIVREFRKVMEDGYVDATGYLRKPLIGKTIEAFFDEDLFNTIAFHVSMGNSDYVAVQHFCDRYGLSIEDVNEENLRKKWRDHLFYMRKKMQTYS